MQRCYKIHELDVALIEDVDNLGRVIGLRTQVCNCEPPFQWGGSALEPKHLTKTRDKLSMNFQKPLNIKIKMKKQKGKYHKKQYKIQN